MQALACGRYATPTSASRPVDAPSAAISKIVFRRGARVLSSRFKVLIGVLIAVALYVHRVRTAIWHPYLYAEDGVVFLQDQLINGPRAFIIPFAGYLHAVPRLTAFIASFFSATWAPAMYAGITAIFMLWTALTIAACRLPYAYLLAALLFAVPHTGEVLGTITNAQWVMACALPLILMTETPASLLNRINQCVFVVLAGLSGPFSIFVAPLSVWRLIKHRDPHSVLLSGLGIAAALIQLATLIPNYVAFHGEREPVHLAITILDRWLGSLAIGWRSESIPEMALTAAFGCVLLFLAWRSSERKLNLAFLLTTCAVLASAWLKFMPAHSRHLDYPAMDDRYFYLPKVMTFWILAGAIYTCEGKKRWLAALCLALGLLSVRHGEHDWWRKYIYPKQEWTTYARDIDAGRAVKIIINPAPYTVTIPERI